MLRRFDLVVESYLTLHGQPVDELIDRLGPVWRPVVDRLEIRHRLRLSVNSDNLSIES
jgi:hypothetical protein